MRRHAPYCAMSAIPPSRLYAAAQVGKRHASALLVALRQFQPSKEMRFQCEVAQFSAISRTHLAPAKAGVHAALRCPIWPPAYAGEQLLPCGHDLRSIEPARLRQKSDADRKAQFQCEVRRFSAISLKAVPRRKPGSTRPCAAPSGPRPTPGHRILRSACSLSRPNSRGRAKSPMPTAKRNSSVKLRSFLRFFPTALLPAMGAA